MDREGWQPTVHGAAELKVKEESEKVGLKLNIQKIKIMATRTYCIAQGAIFSIS